MNHKRLLATIALATVGVGTPLSAQRWRTFEVGAFGQYTMFGDVLQLDNALGLGGMVGFFILPNTVVEGDISFSRTDGPLSGKLTYRPVHARMAYFHEGNSPDFAGCPHQFDGELIRDIDHVE